MARKSDYDLVPRNGRTLIVGIVARISGCASQKELSLDDQVDHAKEEVAALYDGSVEYRVIATKGKGECLTRPELGEVEQLIRSRELDLLVMEDVGRLVRGTAAVTLWGIAVDHGVRVLAPNDCLDTRDETWEEELIAACRDHVGHNAHTSKRLKKKLMNRFKKRIGATSRQTAGYVVPEDAKTYDDWRKEDSATPIIQEGLRRLKSSLNCSAVADWFNQVGFPTGPYCRKKKKWDGKLVRLFFKNRLLAGHPSRGHRYTVKHHETGRRVSVKNPDGPVFLDCPHLAHVNAAELDEVNAMLAAKNGSRRRKHVNGEDPLHRRPRKRALYPSQGGCTCWYCGSHFVWGANGVKENLMCSRSREWGCWNSFGIKGPLVVERLVAVITSTLHNLQDLDAQFAELVSAAGNSREGELAQRWRQQEQDEAKLVQQRENVLAALAEYGPRPSLKAKLDEVEHEEKRLAWKRHELEMLGARDLQLPKSTEELRKSLEEQFQCLAVRSPEFGDLMRQLVPEFHVYLVRLLDGGHPLPRARIRLDLAGSVPDAERVPGLKEMLSRVVTIDLFERPPQRERIREDAVRLAATGLVQRQICALLKEENPKLPVVQQALALDKKMKSLGLESPYVVMLEPPTDYPKLKRHLNPKYAFRPLEGYERPPL
jgi:site-specific DNA recombinase